MRILSILIMCLTTTATWGQMYSEPNTKWPYIYENFTEGTIYSENGRKSTSELNIHLQGNVLHYVNQGRIYESKERGVIRVEIGSDAYIYSNNRLVRILAAEGTSLLVELRRGDFDAMRSGSGAYGASLNSSASRDLSSLSLGGLDNPDIGRLQLERNDGASIPMVTDYFFIVGGIEAPATKKGVESLIGKDRAAEWKQFLKEHKIKWKKEDSLRQVLKFL